MNPDDLANLRKAVQSLENPGLAARLTNLVGKPVELIGLALPPSASRAIATATSRGLELALQAALRTMRPKAVAGSTLLHKALATASGAAGGAFGLVALPVELPLSTIIMMRSIAEIARSEGEDPSQPETALACLQVFALGGGPALMMPQKVDISPSGACWPKLSVKLHVTLPSAVPCRKAGRCWFVSSPKLPRALASS